MAGLPDFGAIQIHRTALPDGVAREAAWLSSAATDGSAAAHIWEGVRGYVVPRSYELLDGFAAVREMCVAHGSPVQVRTSGGGLVPQGPGVLNLSLVWPLAANGQPEPDATYRDLSNALIRAFAQFDIEAQAQAVNGSFCDGRYNLAVQGRKVVGTAQSWRRMSGRTVALAHAVVIVDADPKQLTQQANAFERALGTGRRYQEDALTSVASSWSALHAGLPAPLDLSDQYRKMLSEVLCHRGAE